MPSFRPHGKIPFMKIIKTNRKTLALLINRQGEPEVRAPLHCPDAVIRQFIHAHQRWIDRQLANYRPPKTYAPEELEALRAAARRHIPERVAYYAPLMGVTPRSIKITSARTRYGSCSSSNGLCFSLFLMEKTPRAIDYVVVHELAHILHHNHSPAFYHEIGKILPDYKTRIKELKNCD